MYLVFVIKFLDIFHISFKNSINLFRFYQRNGFFNAIKKIAFILFGFEVDTVFKDLFAKGVFDDAEKVFYVIKPTTIFGKS